MQKLRASAADTRSYRLRLLFFFPAHRPASKSAPSVAGRMIADVKKLRIFWRTSCAETFDRRRAPEILPIRKRQTKESVATKQTTPFRRERAGAARFRAVLVVFLPGYALATHLRPCGRCTGRSYPSYSTSLCFKQLHTPLYAENADFGPEAAAGPVITPRKPSDPTGTSLTTRTRRAHAVSTWHGSRNGTSLPCAQKYPSTCAFGW